MQADLERVLFDEPTILRRLDEIATQISEDYRDRDLTVIAILNGSLMFMADLLRRIPMDRHVLLLDDILDSGGTLSAIREKLQTAKPRSIGICVLLQKKKARQQPVDADYVGFEIEDEFVVGYGLDFMERYRNLPCIGVLRKELIARPNE